VYIFAPAKSATAEGIEIRNLSGRVWNLTDELFASAFCIII